MEADSWQPASEFGLAKCSQNPPTPVRGQKAYEISWLVGHWLCVWGMLDMIFFGGGGGESVKNRAPQSLDFWSCPNFGIWDFGNFEFWDLGDFGQAWHAIMWRQSAVTRWHARLAPKSHKSQMACFICKHLCLMNDPIFV